MDLEALTDFNLVAALGGFGKASRSSGRPKTTLSRRVMYLEESLGVRLFQRGARSLRLTDEGRALYERTHHLITEILDVGDFVATGLSIPSGRLRISVPVLFAHTMIGRIAAGFAKAYPNVVLEIFAEDRNVKLVEDHYDIAIRVNPKPDELLVGRCFARDEMLVVAPASMPVPEGKGLGEPIDVPAVMLTSGFDSGQWTFMRDDRQITLNPQQRLLMSSLIPVRDAVLAGAGVGLLPRSLLGQNGIDQSALKIWGNVLNRPIELWVLHSSRRLASSKVTAFIEYLSNQFPEHQLV
ncbi:LysR family transcriptional regulator [Pseudomonas agarici]|uniref:LysR family transcriptional regulator n=1 Tax=Pseudomonas agarici TaxID=46677 RepID=A0A0X1T7F1_PSEAA|nr:LysR family transcriptional regulator [Pseudomonas agarici]AMB88064.1 LysR family transcriptional regulator [Pseudomonas agarici]NWB92950.1 LysR family transcriptional regulator [Pseudomonas agarici]NWC09217.1 LysR family transcriptional regulator [Pseudomonas agarici]SEK31428.1 DNA-binding transcriptional regulator, LysR family [Pseudomonas agarici]